jgi:hypothetical protein
LIRNAVSRLGDQIFPVELGILSVHGKPILAVIRSEVLTLCAKQQLPSPSHWDCPQVRKAPSAQGYSWQTMPRATPDAHAVAKLRKEGTMVDRRVSWAHTGAGARETAGRARTGLRFRGRPASARFLLGMRKDLLRKKDMLFFCPMTIQETQIPWYQ